MRMWFSPPRPYEFPAFMCTFACFTKLRSTICEFDTGFAPSLSFLVASSASCRALIRSATSLTSSHVR